MLTHRCPHCFDPLPPGLTSLTILASAVVNALADGILAA